MDQDPRRSAFPIDLRLAAIGLDHCAVLPLRRGEVPVELGLRGVTVDVHLNVAGRELPLREQPAHDVRKECLNLGPAMSLAQGMDKSHVRRLVPNLCSELDVSRIHRRRIVRDELANAVGRCLRPAWKNQE